MYNQIKRQLTYHANQFTQKSYVGGERGLSHPTPLPTPSKPFVLLRPGWPVWDGWANGLTWLVVGWMDKGNAKWWRWFDLNNGRAYHTGLSTARAKGKGQWQRQERSDLNNRVQVIAHTDRIVHS